MSLKRGITLSSANFPTGESEQRVFEVKPLNPSVFNDAKFVLESRKDSRYSELLISIDVMANARQRAARKKLQQSGALPKSDVVKEIKKQKEQTDGTEKMESKKKNKGQKKRKRNDNASEVVGGDDKGEGPLSNVQTGSDPAETAKSSDDSKGKEPDAKRAKVDGSLERPARKHPLRVPGMRPGEACFLCKGTDHIAKNCPSKAAADRKKMCLLCRKMGHTVKNCPGNFGAEDSNSKFCYNCGEHGHRLSDCKLPLKDGGTTFAECFVCKQKGHLSKNCPSNPHGIYPKGGSCKLCGGVTHLAKDCPSKLAGQKEKLKISTDPVKPGENGKRIVFHQSGDDLNDDFTDIDYGRKAQFRVKVNFNFPRKGHQVHFASNSHRRRGYRFERFVKPLRLKKMALLEHHQRPRL
ncbi:hypothetical protein R1flu_007207 [Riccia fluitans]|uniref:CCHC-type domain-containing protein n=1 Tax=Riccia fluitans TaxID=41844 RepID=A0ABD1YYE9_9MARC